MTAPLALAGGAIGGGRFALLGWGSIALVLVAVAYVVYALVGDRNRTTS
jgi:hypothetical protein